jgi:hypothetical protein
MTISIATPSAACFVFSKRFCGLAMHTMSKMSVRVRSKGGIQSVLLRKELGKSETSTALVYVMPVLNRTSDQRHQRSGMNRRSNRSQALWNVMQLPLACHV